MKKIINCWERESSYFIVFPKLFSFLSLLFLPILFRLPVHHQNLTSNIWSDKNSVPWLFYINPLQKTDRSELRVEMIVETMGNGYVVQKKKTMWKWNIKRQWKRNVKRHLASFLSLVRWKDKHSLSFLLLHHLNLEKGI